MRSPARAPVTEGERRQLTVLFCDMVGFTELASRLDPEVLQQIVRAYEDTCAACVTRYEGYVFQRLGDGIVAFFGYPLAHEGEAERAIRAGLEIIEALSKLDVPDAGHLAVRNGIATGLVVVSSPEKRAVGETMNLASRLQGIAQPGSIVVSERVQRLAGGAFDLRRFPSEKPSLCRFSPPSTCPICPVSRGAFCAMDLRDSRKKPSSSSTTTTTLQKIPHCMRRSWRRSPKCRRGRP
jgi:class 3 adenylate cyclase